jgi:hypothetical protein
MAGDLLSATALTARFKAGKSALGHRWELFDADDQPVGSTDRAYGGGVVGRSLWRTVTATGLDRGNDIRADVRDAGGQVVAKLFSRTGGDEGKRVEISRPDGELVGIARRTPGEGFAFEAADGRVVGRIPIAEDQPDPWQLVDDRGTAFGVLTREPAKQVAYGSIAGDLLDLPGSAVQDHAREFQNTMHFGFAFSKTYGVTLTELPSGEPLRTLAVLAPVIAGYAY